MFERLKTFGRILVTGPHRSGTRIAAKIIAFDTGHTLIDEFDIEMDSLYLFWDQFQHKSNFVAQCPSLCRYAHIFGQEDDTLIVLMRRPTADIIASQQRIQWTSEKLELARYDRTDGNIADVKYQFWDNHQKAQIKHTSEIAYEQLADHELWVDREKRAWTWAAQTVPENVEVYRQSNILLWQNPTVMYYPHPGENTGDLIKTKKQARQLNEVGGLIWSLCDGSHGFNEILNRLKQEFEEVPEAVLREDLEQFLRKMLRLDFIRMTKQG